MRNALITILIAFCVGTTFAQSKKDSTRKMIGRVVEAANGQTKGVPKITIRISDDFDYDITDEYGNFDLDIPPDRDFVTIIVENTPNKMIAPPYGLVNVPPDRDLKIILCGEQNQRLMDQVNALNGRVKKLEKERDFNKVQLLAYHRAMLDTIIYFENLIAFKEQEAKKNEEILSSEIRARNAVIEELKDSIFILTQRLGKALEDKFLRQKQYFDQISAELLTYQDRLYDLRDRLMPDRLGNYFRNNYAIQELNKTSDAYNEARQAIIRNHKGHIMAVRQEWENPDIASQLEETYKYLLKTVHDELVFPLHKEVVGPIQDFAGKQTGPVRAEKESKKAAEVRIPPVSVAIPILEERIRDVIHAMSKNI